MLLRIRNLGVVMFANSVAIMPLFISSVPIALPQKPQKVVVVLGMNSLNLWDEFMVHNLANVVEHN